MKRFTYMAMVALLLGGVVGTFLFSLVTDQSPGTPDALLQSIEDKGLGPVEKVGDLLYLNDRGEYIQFFPQLPGSGAAEAAVYEYDVTSADGFVWKSATTYSGAHEAASGTVDDSGGSIRVGQNKVATDDVRIYRGGLFFDTSAIPDDAVISYADVLMELGSDESSVDFHACLVDGSDLGAGLVATDYAVLGESDAVKSSFDSADWAGYEGEYIPFVLSAGGISDIDFDGITAFGFRSYWDIVESAPVGEQNYTIRPTYNSSNLGWVAEPVLLEDYECVDETAPNNNTDYVWCSQAGSCQWGWLDFDNTVVTGGDGDPLGVTVRAWGCECYDAGTPNVCYSGAGTSTKYKIVMRTHSTDYYSPWLESATCWTDSYTLRSMEWELNPFTSAQWTWDEVDAMTVQLERWSSHGTTIRITMVYVDISYIPAGSGPEYADFASYEMGANHLPYLTVVYNIGDIPGAPTDLLCEGYEHPITDEMSPAFSARAHHGDAGVTLNSYALQVDDIADFSSPTYSSGQRAFSANITDGQRCEDVYYAGLPMDLGTRYYWRIKFFDEDEDEGPWSSVSYFDFSTPTDCPTELIAKPLSSETIILTWTEASNYGSTGIFWQFNAYPASREDENQVCITANGDCEHTSLIAGSNYYYSAWGYDPASGNWSDCYVSDWATTLAGDSDDVSPPPVPPEWEQSPNCDLYSSIPFIYDPIVGTCTSFGMPEGTGCLFFTVGMIMFAGIASYVASRRSEIVLLLVLAVGILVAAIGGALPMWIIAIELPLGGGILYIWKRA